MANINRMAILMTISEITPQLFLAGQMAATLEQVQRLGITYIVNVAIESSVITYPKHIKIDKFDIMDFPTAPISNYFNTITDKIHAHITANKHNRVLVHCMAGISRSTTIICAYLMRYMHMTLRDAYSICKRSRPICFPNLGFWTQLIAYELQLRKENSVKMISTQYGYVPDVALEEIKQMRQQIQGPSPVSLAFSPPTFNSTTNTNPPAVEPSLFSSSQNRTITGSTGTIRSRSLAPNPPARTIIEPTTINLNNPAYRQPMLPATKQTYLNPTRFDIRRLNPGASGPIPNPPAAPVSSSMSYASSRTLPANSSSSVKTTVDPLPPSPRLQPTSLSPRQPNYAERQNPQYETTYRASFIKPLVP